MDNDKPTSPRTIVRSVQNDLPEAAPSIVMSDTSVVSLPRESELVRDHKSYVSCLVLLLGRSLELLALREWWRRV